MIDKKLSDTDFHRFMDFLKSLHSSPSRAFKVDDYKIGSGCNGINIIFEGTERKSFCNANIEGIVFGFDNDGEFRDIYIDMNEDYIKECVKKLEEKKNDS